MKRKSFLVLSLVLVFALSFSSVFADTTTTAYYDVTMLKSNNNLQSMAQGIVNGQAEVVTTYNDNGGVVSVDVKIPIKPILNYRPMGFLPPADGYLRKFKINGSLINVVGGTGFYNTAEMRFSLDAMPSDHIIPVEKAFIDLFKAGTANSYGAMTHISPAFRIKLTD